MLTSTQKGANLYLVGRLPPFEQVRMCRSDSNRPTNFTIPGSKGNPSLRGFDNDQYGETCDVFWGKASLSRIRMHPVKRISIGGLAAHSPCHRQTFSRTIGGFESVAQQVSPSVRCRLLRCQRVVLASVLTTSHAGSLFQALLRI